MIQNCFVYPVTMALCTYLILKNPRKTNSQGMIVLSPSGYILCNHAFHTLNIVFSHKSRPSDVYMYLTGQSWLWVKVIPLFCTAHPLLRITLWHPRWRRFFPLARKQQTRTAFAELQLLFAIIMPQIGWQVPGLLSKSKKMKEICVIPNSAAVFHFAAVVVELLKCPGWGFGILGLWSLWDNSMALQLH